MPTRGELLASFDELKESIKVQNAQLVEQNKKLIKNAEVLQHQCLSMSAIAAMLVKVQQTTDKQKSELESVGNEIVKLYGHLTATGVLPEERVNF